MVTNIWECCWKDQSHLVTLLISLFLSSFQSHWQTEITPFSVSLPRKHIFSSFPSSTSGGPPPIHFPILLVHEGPNKLLMSKGYFSWIHYWNILSNSLHLCCNNCEIWEKFVFINKCGLVELWMQGQFCFLVTFGIPSGIGICSQQWPSSCWTLSSTLTKMHTSTLLIPSRETLKLPLQSATGLDSRDRDTIAAASKTAITPISGQRVRGYSGPDPQLHEGRESTIFWRFNFLQQLGLLLLQKMHFYTWIRFLAVLVDINIIMGRLTY